MTTQHDSGQYGIQLKYRHSQSYSNGQTAHRAAGEFRAYLRRSWKTRTAYSCLLPRLAWVDPTVAYAPASGSRKPPHQDKAIVHGETQKTAQNRWPKEDDEMAATREEGLPRLTVGWTTVGTPRPRSRSEEAIRATLTRTPSASSFLRARRAVFSSVKIRSNCRLLHDERKSDSGKYVKHKSFLPRPSPSFSFFLIDEEASWAARAVTHLLAVLEYLELVLEAGGLVAQVGDPVARLRHELAVVGQTLLAAQHRDLRLEVGRRHIRCTRHRRLQHANVAVDWLSLRKRRGGRPRWRCVRGIFSPWWLVADSPLFLVQTSPPPPPCSVTPLFKSAVKGLVGRPVVARQLHVNHTLTPPPRTMLESCVSRRRAHSARELRARGLEGDIEVNMERRRNEGAGETGDTRGNPPTNDIVRHDSHLRKSGDPAGGAAIAERLARSPPTKANRAGRCRWSAGILEDLPFPPPLHSGAAPYSLQSLSSALKISLLRVKQISLLTR
ncbi:hypothetical protein PR048_008103 [Dryococelus australis]|uniref:Uncharacterized protein n=1 Tax=Dryococelus australis TaxID=614101 RepID=A0ABQ9HW50_9NEOP|nr:hypothetical protein PR048_008103 [Dryococelus australis]